MKTASIWSRILRVEGRPTICHEWDSREPRNLSMVIHAQYVLLSPNFGTIGSESVKRKGSVGCALCWSPALVPRGLVPLRLLDLHDTVYFLLHMLAVAQYIRVFRPIWMVTTAVCNLSTSTWRCACCHISAACCTVGHIDTNIHTQY